MSNDREAIKLFNDAAEAGAREVDIQHNSNDDNLTAPGIAGLTAFIGFYAFGQLLIHAVKIDGVSLATAGLSCGGVMATAVFSGLYIFSVMAGGLRFYADFNTEPEPEPIPPALIPTAQPGRRVKLTSEGARKLIVFAKRYPAVKKLGINEWEGKNSPLTRKEYKEVLAMLKHIGAAVPKPSGKGYVLSEYGLEQVLKWAVEDFGDIVELGT